MRHLVPLSLVINDSGRHSFVALPVGLFPGTAIAPELTATCSRREGFGPSPTALSTSAPTGTHGLAAVSRGGKSRSRLP